MLALLACKAKAKRPWAEVVATAAALTTFGIESLAADVPTEWTFAAETVAALAAVADVLRLWPILCCCCAATAVASVASAVLRLWLVLCCFCAATALASVASVLADYRSLTASVAVPTIVADSVAGESSTAAAAVAAADWFAADAAV